MVLGLKVFLAALLLVLAWVLLVILPKDWACSDRCAALGYPVHHLQVTAECRCIESVAPSQTRASR